MTRAPIDRRVPPIASLLAAERCFAAEPAEVRHRAVERARAALPRCPPTALPSWAPRRQRARVAELCAAALLLSAFGAMGYLAGYHAPRHGAAPSAAAPALASTIVVLTVTRPPLGAPSTTPAASAPPAIVAPARPSAAKPAPLPAREAYARELLWLQPARQAVARRDFAAALAAIAEHQRRFPTGQLAEEREALRVKALLGAGRAAEAQRAGDDFRERFPRSALGDSIDTMVGHPP